MALAVIYDGGARREAARLGGVTPQIVRDWVLRFNGEGPRGLIDRKPPGQPRLLTGATFGLSGAKPRSGVVSGSPKVHQ